MLDTTFVLQNPFIEIVLSYGLLYVMFYKVLFRVNGFVEQEFIIFYTENPYFFSPLVFV